MQAVIRKISEVKPHPNADKLELATVEGWQVCIQKGAFKAGDLCVYVCIDSLLPIRPEFEFLRKSCLKKLPNGTEGFKIKTIKLRQALSQGICFALKDIPQITNQPEGTDVSELLGVKHYEKPIPAQLAGEVKGNFPSFIPKTDEPMVQNYLGMIEELKGKPYYISEKADGSSVTIFYNKGEFGVCSRNLELKESETNSFWRATKKYDLQNRMANYGKNISLQCEIVGPGIQKNPYKLNDIELKVFNVYDIDAQHYLGYKELIHMCSSILVPMVTVLDIGDSFPETTIAQLIEKAKGLYPSGVKREGIVIRPKEEMFSQTYHGRMSFKVLNNDQQLEEE